MTPVKSTRMVAVLSFVIALLAIIEGIRSSVTVRIRAAECSGNIFASETARRGPEMTSTRVTIDELDVRWRGTASLSRQHATPTFPDALVTNDTLRPGDRRPVRTADPVQASIAKVELQPLHDLAIQRRQLETERPVADILRARSPPAMDSANPIHHNILREQPSGRLEPVGPQCVESNVRWLGSNEECPWAAVSREVPATA